MRQTEPVTEVNKQVRLAARPSGLPKVRGPANYLSLLVSRASMTGMLVFDYHDRYGPATAELAQWLGEGRLVAREHIVRGSVTDFPEVLLMLFTGENTGKLILATGGG